MKNTNENDDLIIDPLSDIFILYLFGSAENNQVLLDFINAVLIDVGFQEIVEVEVLNPFNIRTFINDKLSILDVKAKDGNGRIYDIEVQSISHNHYINRSLYYWARNYSKQLTKAENYDTLKPVISINLLKDKIFKQINKVHSVFMPFELEYKEKPLTDHLQIHYIELKKYIEGMNVKTKLTDWLDYFKNEGNNKEAEMQTLLDKSNIIREAHEIYNRFTTNDELRDIYEAREKFILDQNTNIFVAHLEEKRSTLIRLISKKFQISDKDTDMINECSRTEKLDEALDEILFANDKETVLKKLR